MSSIWRPIMAFAFTLAIVCMVLTVCLLLLFGMTNLAEAASIFAVAIPTLATPVSLYVAGRSFEKGKLLQSRQDQSEN